MRWIRDMKKRSAAAICLCACLCLAGCGRVMDRYEEKKTGYTAAASCYPIYCLCLMAMEGIEGAELHCLIQPQDGCLRAYEWSEWDMRKAAEYDLLVLGGRGLESYGSQVGAWEDGPAVLTVMTGMELMGQGQSAGEDGSHFEGENPWLFLSPDGAEKMLKSICANLQGLDPEYEEKYAENYEKAAEKIRILGEDMRYAGLGLEGKRAACLQEGIVYFAEFMGIGTVYTYPRESGENVVDNDLEALLEGLHESGAEAVLVEEQAPDSLVWALEDAGYRVCRIDVLSAHMEDGDAEGYIRIMKENAERWKETWYEKEQK